jgi:hypothetical protein
MQIVPEAAELFTVHSNAIFPFCTERDATRKNETAFGSWALPETVVSEVGNVNEALNFSTVCARSTLAEKQRMQHNAVTFLVTISPPLIVLVNRLISAFIDFIALFQSPDSI